MQRSTERILTTHVGSLVRPGAIAEVLRAESLGQPYDAAAFERILAPAVADVVRKQADVGVDIPSDGEFGKVMWTQYVIERLGGIERRELPPGSALMATSSKDRQDFAEFYAVYNPISLTMWLDPVVLDHLNGAPLQPPGRWVCTQPITYTGRHALQRDIINFLQALKSTQVTEAFLPLAAPASVEATIPNEYYASDEEYVYALADALREEYLQVIDAGLLLQVDDAFIPYNYDRMLLQGASMEEYRKHCEMRIEAVNHALRGIPEDRVRYHICWGSWAGPHTSDVPLAAIADLLLRVNAQAYSVEAANPRHEYEWKVWRDVARLPEGKILIPGVITHSTNVVEHPETVAERIERYASVVGRENVIAGTDCGFSQGWTMNRTHSSVQWAKLQALADGARLASGRLWGVHATRAGVTQ
ncbi:MAG: cobalamin-independent methionine synthase II family protein [Chloroflexi bacterium]|nr:cobalamin-independent methionine synthase II family protein [Chloroflexota bacterium]